MFKLVRTNSEEPDFIALVKCLDADLAIRDGADHAFYDQFNKIDTIKYAVILYKNDMAIGCGAIKEFEPNIMEVKRMYTKPEFRGQGCASKILFDLETWAKEMNYDYCVLETGKKQPEAIQLYLKNGYLKRPNYGQYRNVENSVCFQKKL